MMMNKTGKKLALILVAGTLLLSAVSYAEESIPETNFDEDFNQQIRSSLRGFEGMDEEEIHQRVAALLPRSGQMADEVASYVARLVAEKKKTGSKIGLTAREKEIVLLSAEGLSSAKIAEKLFISVHTVNNHKQNIYAKMGVKSNSEMIHQATKLGLI